MSDPLRELERASLRQFVASCADLFTGVVLDYGCGLAPYRDIVEGAGATWNGVDDPHHPGSVLRDRDWRDLSAAGYIFGDSPFSHDERYGAILCTQVIQYVHHPLALLTVFAGVLARNGGSLVLTGPTNWPVVETEDLWRYTPSGISHLLHDAGFTVERLEQRATIPSPGGSLLLGWGVVAVPR